ncbi:MAG: ABC transporter permease [Bacillota bacterium]
MFNKLYQGEIKKILRPKTMIFLAFVLIAFLIIYAITYNISTDYTEPMEQPPAEASNEYQINEIAEGQINQYDILYGNTIFTEENIDEYISVATEELERQTNEIKANKFYYRMTNDPIFQQKGLVAALEHIKENELYGEEIQVYGPGGLFEDKTAQDFMYGFFTLLMTIILIYGVVIGASSYAGEMQSGSLKMMFMRPITRNKLTTAKILALFTVITIIMALGSIMALIYGAIKYSFAPNESILVVFNAMAAFMGTNGLMLFLNMVFGLVEAFAMILFAFALATITKNRIVPIIFGVLLNIGIIAMLLSLLKIGRFLFTTNIDFSIFFGVSSAVPPGGNFFITIGMFAAYITLFLASSYIVFNKRDIA